MGDQPNGGPAPVDTSAEAVADMARRLRGEYRIPITDGLGAAGGEEPENALEFVRHFPSPPIQKDAADMIEALAARVAELELFIENDADWKFSAKRRLELLRGARLDAKLANARAEAALAQVAALTEATKPFAEMTAELFARNWNKDQVVVALDNPNDPHRLTFGDFLALHAALKGATHD